MYTSQESHQIFSYYILFIVKDNCNTYDIYPALISYFSKLSYILGYNNIMNNIFEKAYSELDISVDGCCIFLCVVIKLSYSPDF